MLPSQGIVERAFVVILSQDPTVLRHLLSSECKLRHHLGIKEKSELSHLHDVVILRLAKCISASVIMQTQVHNVIAPVVSAYWRILTYTQGVGTNTVELLLVVVVIGVGVVVVVVVIVVVVVVVVVLYTRLCTSN
ncbi:hypothetical protein ElyMa_005072400 [Elysia marginata]|uniref:Uncharacterized protein n=1 Tax=Elysia marginata TaxID=1093978 RepID=A0AAV4JDZ8_9GAST|nr:hypothetical protein ElyMa_005072400 [Elysia marginata]